MREIKINKQEYRIDSITAKEAYSLIAELVKLSGVAADYLPTLMNLSENSDETADMVAFSMSSYMINQNGVDAFVELKEKVISMAEIKSESGAYNPVDLDRDFMGDLSGAEQLFDAVLQEHFDPLLKGGSGTSPAALALLLNRNLFRTMN